MNKAKYLCYGLLCIFLLFSIGCKQVTDTRQEYPTISADNFQFLKIEWLNGKSNCEQNSDLLTIKYVIINKPSQYSIFYKQTEYMSGAICNVFDNGVSRVYNQNMYISDNSAELNTIHLTLKDNHILKVCCKGEFYGLSNDVYHTNEVCLPDITVTSPC